MKALLNRQPAMRLGAGPRDFLDIQVKPCSKTRGHPELNQGPLDLQSNALPLSYIPLVIMSLTLYLNVEYFV